MIDLKTLKQVKVVNIRCIKGQCKVRPSGVLASHGSKIVFANKTDDIIHVQIAGIGAQFSIGANKNASSSTIPATPWWGVYPYAVFCKEKMRFGTGSDMPIIIVPPAVPNRN